MSKSCLCSSLSTPSISSEDFASDLAHLTISSSPWSSFKTYNNKENEPFHSNNLLGTKQPIPANQDKSYSCYLRSTSRSTTNAEGSSKCHSLHLINIVFIAQMRINKLFHLFKIIKDPLCLASLYEDEFQLID